MASYQIKQASAAYPLVFLMVQASDHITGLTGASPTVTLSKAGAAFGAPAGTVTEIANGWYKVAGNATDSGTLGPLALHATATGGDPVDVLFEVVAHDVQDAMRLGLGALPNAAANASGGLPILTGTTLNYTIATLTTYTGNTLQTGDSFARIGASGAGLTALASQASVTALGSPITLSAALSTPRALDAVADGSLTVNDALWSAILAGAGKLAGATGSTSLVAKTPSTGTILRTFTLDVAINQGPTSRA